jgi:hypothetical protein
MSATPELPLWPAVAHVAAAVPCANGFDIVATSSNIFPEGVMATSSRRAVLVGGAPRGFGSKAAVIARVKGHRWQVVSRRTLGRDAGYMAVDGAAGTSWAVDPSPPAGDDRAAGVPRPSRQAATAR